MSMSTMKAACQGQQGQEIAIGFRVFSLAQSLSMPMECTYAL